MVASLKPAPLGDWYKQRLAAERVRTVQIGSDETRAPESLALAPYTPEIARAELRPGCTFPPRPVANGGTQALREACALIPEVVFFPSSAAHAQLADAMFERVAAHLRNVGIAHRIGDDRRITLLPSGSHPFVDLVGEAHDRNLPVGFDVSEGWERIGAAVCTLVDGRRWLRLGPREILRLDRNSATLEHERFHIVTDLTLGKNPYVAMSTTIADGRERLSLPLGQSYARMLSAQEPGAYAAGCVNGLADASAAIRAGDPNARAWVRYALLSHVAGGIRTSLGSIAASKHALAAMAEGKFAWLRPGQFEGGVRGQFLLRVDRGPGREFAILLHPGSSAMRTAIDAALGGVGGVSSRTKQQLLEQFAWQERAAQEHLNLFRVVAQALEPMLDGELDARVCEVAGELLLSGRAARDANCDPISYEQALLRFNVLRHLPSRNQ